MSGFFVGILLSVEVAVDVGVDGVERGVFGVDVVDGSGEGADGFDGVDALPEEVAGVKVRTDGAAAGLAHAEHGLGVVDEKAGVGFEGDLDVAGLGEGGLLLPVRDGDFVPLPIEDFEEVGRPGAGDPVRVFGAGVVAGAAGEGGDDGDSSLSASFTVSWKTLWWSLAIFLSGCRALPWQERELISSPLPVMTSRKWSSLVLLARSSAGLQWALPG